MSNDLAVTPFEARPVDPRDAGWEVWDPEYRVRFWRQLGDGAWTSRDFQVASTDIASVLSWADRERNGGEEHQVFAVVSRGGDLGVVRLAGEDPTRP